MHKFAFETESGARQAFASWSYVRILTLRNREVDFVGIVFAPRCAKEGTRRPRQARAPGARPF